MSAEVLRRAASQMRFDAEACGDKQNDFIPAVADWLDVVAARNESLLSSFAEGSRAGAVTAVENTLGWHEAIAVVRAYLGEQP